MGITWTRSSLSAIGGDELRLELHKFEADVVDPEWFALVFRQGKHEASIYLNRGTADGAWTQECKCKCHTTPEREAAAS